MQSNLETKCIKVKVLLHGVQIKLNWFPDGSCGKMQFSMHLAKGTQMQTLNPLKNVHGN